jgi:hypothetical protein
MFFLPIALTFALAHDERTPALRADGSIARALHTIGSQGCRGSLMCVLRFGWLQTLKIEIRSFHRFIDLGKGFMALLIQFLCIGSQ